MPHLFAVGQPYHGDRKIWPEIAQLHWMSGELDLVLFFDRPSRHEIDAVRAGRAEFALYDADGQVIVSYRFEGKRANVPWSDAPYQWHRVPPDRRVAPPEETALTPETRVKLYITLVNAMGGLVEALRITSLSPEFTRALFAAIRRQAAAPYERVAYEWSLQVLFSKYTSEQLASASAVRCFGGA
jgi:hypothetical protein